MPEGNKNIKQCLLLSGRIIVAVAALSAIAWKQDWNELWSVLRQLDIAALAGATGLFMIGGVLISYRWYLLLKSQDIRIAVGAALKVNFLGMFYNNFLLSSIGGDVLRAWYITKHTSKKVEAAFSVLVDRFIGLLSILIMALTALFFLPGKDVLLAHRAEVGESSLKNIVMNPHLWWSAAIIAVSVMAAIVLIPATRRAVLRVLKKVNEKKYRLLSAVVLYFKRPKAVCFATFVTFVSQILTIIGMVIIGRNLSIDCPAKYYFVFFPIGWLVASLPISPGGIGVLEFGLVSLFSFVVTVSAEEALTLALCQRLVFILGSLPGIFIHISGLHLPDIKKEFSVDS